MKWIQTLAIAVVLAAASQGVAAPEPGWVTADPQVLAEARAATRTLDRAITVYHWVDRRLVAGDATRSLLPETGPVDLRDPAVVAAVGANLETRMARFWDLSLPVSGRAEDGGAMAPNGLYVATEPVVSRSYGGARWLLVELRLPQGTRFIDGRYRRAALGPHLVKALEQRGCRNPLPVTARDPVFAARNLLKADTHQTACRQALVDVAAATGAPALLYIFRSEPVPACRAVFPWNAAFVIVDPAAVEVGSVQPFVAEVPPQDDGLHAQRRVLNRVFQHAGLPPLFAGVGAADDADMRGFVRERYFACNAALREW